MKKIISTIYTSFFILLAMVTPVLADSDGSSGYQPYQPQDTGAEFDLLIIGGIVLYALGMIFIAYSRIFKKKLLQK